MEFCYKCSYDGNKCNTIIPSFDKARLVGITTETWDSVCGKCERNYSIGRCYGKLSVEREDGMCKEV